MIILVFLGYGFVSKSSAQSVPDIIESQMEEIGEDEFGSNASELLFEYMKNPLDLNKASIEDLQQLQFLSSLQIQAFINYRNTNGLLLSLYELQVIPGFDLAVIRKILPFVTVDDQVRFQGPLWKRIVKERNNYWIIRHGYKNSDSAFTNPNYWLFRFKIRHKDDFSIGLTAEKDAGEPLTWAGDQKLYLMDHLSGHIMIENRKYYDQLILGDFQVQAGQGLVFGAGIFSGKTSEAVRMVKKPDLGISPYSSTAEQDFFRGIAASFKIFDQIHYKTFISYQNIDARLSTEDSLNWQVSSLPTTGLHRTPSEILTRKTLGRFSTGSVLNYSNQKQNLKIGLTAAYTHFEYPIAQKESLFQRFEFSGTKNLTSSLYFSYLFKNMHFFSEAALSKNYKTAFIGGLLAQLHTSIALAIVFRRYNKAYHSFYGKAFGENSQIENESGIYLGLEFNPFHRLSFKAYFDQFSFPWLKYRTDAPSEGFEWLILARYAMKKNTVAKLQFKHEQKSKNTLLPKASYNIVLPARLSKTFLSLEHTINDRVSIKSRIQYSFHHFNRISSDGFLAFQEFTIDYQKFKLSSRITLFDSEVYDTRQYVYEKGLWPSFNLPAYYGKGINTYALLKFKYYRMQFSAKVSYTTQEGSSQELTSSDPFLSKLSLLSQVLYRFNH